MYGYDLDFHVDIANDMPKGETTLPAARDRVKKITRTEGKPTRSMGLSPGKTNKN